MRQSNKCESVRKDEIFNLHLGSGAGPCVRTFVNVTMGNVEC